MLGASDEAVYVAREKGTIGNVLPELVPFLHNSLAMLEHRKNLVISVNTFCISPDG